METIKRPVVARSLQGDNTQSTEGFMSNENTSNDILINICHYTFVQTHRMYSTMKEPQGELWTFGDYGAAM